MVTGIVIGFLMLVWGLAFLVTAFLRIPQEFREITKWLGTKSQDDSTLERLAAAGIEATRQLLRASTLAERGPPSIAGYSPNTSPGPISLKLTALPASE